MKIFITIIFLFTVLSISAQQPISFKEILRTAQEIPIRDSILIDDASAEKVFLDKNAGKIVYKILNRKEATDSNQTDDYCIAGKITRHKDFDILLLYDQQSTYTGSYSTCCWESYPKSQSTTKELFFILFDKEGNYKNIFLAAMNYRKEDYTNKYRWNTKIKSIKINTWIYPDLRIIQQTRTGSWIFK